MIANSPSGGGAADIDNPAVVAAIEDDPAAVREAVASDLGPILLVGDGQSNMHRGSFTSVTILRDDVFAWNGSAWLTAGQTATGAMVIKAAEKLAADTGRAVYCVVSGEMLMAISNWVGAGTSSTKYVATKALVEGALASTQLATAGKTKIDAFIWMQGEADGNSTTYVADFTALTNQLAAETWWQALSTRIIIPRVADSFAGNGIRSAQIQIGNSNPWWISVPTTGAGIEADLVHFSPSGLADIGLRIASAYHEVPRHSIESSNIRADNQEVYIGWRAGEANTGTGNILIGNECATSNTGSNVIAIGYRALKSNTQAYAVALGHKAGETNTGTFGTFVGVYAGRNNTGNAATFVGNYAGLSNTAATTTFIGYTAGQVNTGISSTGIGVAAGKNNTGTRMTGLGVNAGLYNKSVNSTYIGVDSGPQSDAAGTTGTTFSNCTVLGYLAQSTRANQVTLGNASVTEVITAATKIIYGALPNYADDAAADADATLISGSLYRVAGGRAVYQKP